MTNNLCTRAGAVDRAGSYPPPEAISGADPDFDAVARRLHWSLRHFSDLRRHWLLCRLYFAGEYREVGSRRLHAVADALDAKKPIEALLSDTLRLLAELDAIATLGIEGAGRSQQHRLRSPTAALFGRPKDVLRSGIEACLREHYDGGQCLCRYRFR